MLSIWNSKSKLSIYKYPALQNIKITCLYSTKNKEIIGGTDNSMIIIWKIEDEKVEIVPKKEGKRIFEFRENI